MPTPQSRLLKLADEAVADYNATHAAGGEAVYPSWVEDVRLLCNAAPGVSTVEDAQDENDVLSWLEVEIGAINCRYHGDPSYDHDAYWMRDRVLKLIEDARKAFCAPAAVDALDAGRYRWLCDKFGITKLPCAIERIIEGSYVADGKEAIDAAIDAALAAQRKGDA